MILRALRYYLLAEGAEIKKAAEGLEQIRNGDSHDAEDVLRELEEIVHGKVA
ncbi:hypothetical protein [Devosia sp. YR412]|uniref:hypothetical protein n=1 Tax=Devosia sp. YR412 TaxID=1881030 RepID=UPI001FCD4B63|nr:hypothetical protein [Devosia sp. YR412]